MAKNNICISHCCIIHGCKYGHKDCPVSTGVIRQQYMCEDCYNDIQKSNEYKSLIKYRDNIKKIFLNKNRKIKLKKINMKNLS